MERDFVKLMSTLSEESLQVYIDQRRKYLPSAVFAAIDELKKRGKHFSDFEINQIKLDLDDENKKSLRRIEEAEMNDGFNIFNNASQDVIYKKQKKSGTKHSPNHIPANERAKCLLFSVGLILYGTFGFYIDDLYVPGKRSRGLHFHGIPCLVMYLAFLFAAITFLSVVVDHYDKRNNETNYQKFSKACRLIGWALFFAAIILDIFVYHQATRQ